MKNQAEHVFIGKYETTCILRIEGRLTQRSLRNTNAAVQQCLENATLTNALLDITQCSYMDSTILGIIAHWAITFTETHSALPFLVGLEGSPLENIFRRMNLTTLFHVCDNTDIVQNSTLAHLSFSEEHYSTAEYAHHVLSAHETLAQLSPENAREFAAVIRYLQAEIDQQT
ncbi:hypothetical protein GF339_02685 [candidate division KSB3 bacterium]|uniref:STAS domain-containing protein n=1 Tax=candidate division KSB3 bacterium TaxID=2044937 RepID=A0A9D5Q512_9BACT|nr:hypothetical protein [candidate division KSB3 bacterium]MBD3323461.1 hypothetical protein [candidate division KSB3 bacterium]